MAKKKVETKIETKHITEAELSKIAYSKLEAKFIELGVQSAWVPGGKKIVMVKNAIEKLGIINKMKEAGIDQDAIDSQLELAEVTKKEEAAKLEAEIKLAKEKAEKKVEKGIAAKGYDKPTLQKILANIDMNLQSGIETHREILIKKRKVIVDLIAKADK